MSANVFMSLSMERGNVFHNKYLHTLEQICRLFFRGKNGKNERGRNFQVRHLRFCYFEIFLFPFSLKMVLVSVGKDLC